MGHATHFLSRLGRLELPEVELALSLYRDTPLLRELLNHARIPEGVDRVAIGLRREEGGPHLLVSRDGGFVTCLGPGMTPRNVEIIARPRFEKLVERVETVRERMAIADALMGPGKNTQELIGRISSAGHALSREEFLGVSAFTPLMVGHFLKIMVELAQIEIRCWNSFSRALDRGGAKYVVRKHDELLLLWNELWAAGHMAALCSEHISDFVEQASKLVDEPFPRMSGVLVEIGFYPAAVRGALLLAGIGSAALPAYAEAYTRGTDWMEFIDGATGLMILGGRDPSCRSQVLELLANPSPVRSPMLDRLGDWKEELLPHYRLLVENPEAAPEMLERVFGSWDEVAAQLPDGFRWKKSAPSKETIAALCLVTSGNNPVRIEDELILFPIQAAAAASCEPADLYFPRAVVAQMERTQGEEWAILQMVRLLKRYRAYYWDRPERVEHVAKPNERCPCGSGQKYKRCCMNKAA